MPVRSLFQQNSTQDVLVLKENMPAQLIHCLLVGVVTLWCCHLHISIVCLHGTVKSVTCVS